MEAEGDPPPATFRLVVDPGLRTDDFTHSLLEAYDVGVTSAVRVWPPLGCTVEGAYPPLQRSDRQPPVDGLVRPMALLGLRQSCQQLGVSEAEPAVLDLSQDRRFQFQDPEGIYSSRRIAKACEERVDFMVVSGMQTPDFRTISDFVRSWSASAPS